ncbi:DUF4951 domain-containing protein [Streptomyces sp. NPDC048340]|uniref:DUF4951 domain-containing protein n=1 Tax=Streptomyces sp. NPDC048340 TaxID=3365537 RepID=UPI00371C5732
MWGVGPAEAEAALAHGAEHWQELGVTLEQARAFKLFYEDAVKRGRGGDSAAPRARLMADIIKKLGG